MSIIDKNLDEVVFFLAERMMRQVREQTKRHLKQEGHGITVDQWVILKRISEVDGISQVDLANSTFKDPAAVTRMLDILEKKGFVERRAKPNDRRTHEIVLTEPGTALVEQVIPIAQHWRSKSLEGLREADIHTTKEVLKKMYENLR